MWRSRPVFISSTFADMQAERDYLRTRVFPELEERLRARRRNLEWVDLRVGVVTASERDEHVRELHVLKVCLDEVRRCRPFLIVLLGDRYGWVPPEDRIKSAAEEASAGFSANVAGRSVTDLEIEFGVLLDPEQQQRSFFYFREPLPYADMPAEISALYSEDYASDAAKADRKERLAALKNRIVRQLGSRVRRYAVCWDAAQQHIAGLDAWGRTVLEDVWRELEAETRADATAADIPWQQAERDALDDFIDDRSRDFVGRQALMARLSNLCLSPAVGGASWGACITGDPGSGKSALFGALHRVLGARDVFLLAHASSASVAAASVDSMLQRFIGELAGALGTDPGLTDNADPDTVDATFARLLGQMAQKQRVVVLIDALDQFENTTRGRFATWLPRLWPANARLVATAIASDGTKAVGERPGVEALSLPPLDATEARDIVVGICRRYHRTFEPEVIEGLLAKRAAGGPVWGNPLWLVLSVEELNLLDADDFARAQRDYAGTPAERLRALMLDTIASFPVDIPGLYAHTFARAEELFGAGLTRGFLGLIAVSRAGWRESDFRLLLPRATGENWDELKFAQLRRLFRGQMRQRGALARWDFSHAQMRAAVRAKLAPWSISEKSLHTVIADRLLSCSPNDPLHISETMVHLLGSEDWQRAVGYYADETLTPAELDGATRVLADEVITATASTGDPNRMPRVMRLLDAASLDQDIAANTADRIFRDLHTIIEARASIDARLPVYRWGQETLERRAAIEPRNGLWLRILSHADRSIGNMLLAKRDIGAALDNYNKGLALAQRLANGAPDEMDFKYNLAMADGSIAETYRIQGNLHRARDSYRAGIALLDSLVASGKVEKSWQHDLAVQQLRLGKILETCGDLTEALARFKESFAVMRRLAAAEPHDTRLQDNLSASCNAIAQILLKQGDSQGALKNYQAALIIAERIASSDPTNINLQHALSVCLSSVANAQVKVPGNRNAALTSSRKSLKIIERLVAADPARDAWHRDMTRTLRVIGRILLDQHDLEQALAHFKAALAVIRRRMPAGDDNSYWLEDLCDTHFCIGDAQLAQGVLASALVSYLTAAGIQERLCAADPGNAEFRFRLANMRGKIGDTLLSQGNLNEALESYLDATAVMDRLVASDPQNALWQSNLASVLGNLGILYQLLGKPAESALSLRRGIAIAESLLRKRPDDANWRGYITKSRELLLRIEPKSRGS